MDTWVEQYKSHANFKYIFRENGRDVLNKQNPESVKRTLKYLAEQRAMLTSGWIRHQQAAAVWPLRCRDADVERSASLSGSGRRPRGRRRRPGRRPVL